MLEIDSVSVFLPGFSLQDISFSVQSSDFFALLGPTGSGKSILLEAIMGLLPVGKGAIRISGQDISGYPPESRKLGLVYQDHALFPHLTVQENLVYGVKYHNISKAIQERRFGLLVERLKLGDLLHRSPTTLSGGEKQRTALARALMLNPRALLLDEPLSALDQMFRDDARRLLKTLHQELAIPFILVSHSFSEVLFLANKGAIIKQGRLQQCGSIGDLFERPQSTFVASFVGMSNVFSCRVSKDLAQVNGLGLYTRSGAEPGHTHLAVRPEEIRLADLEETSHENTLCGQITQLDCQGFYYRVEIMVQNTAFLAYWTRHAVEEKRIQTGQDVHISIPASVVHTFAEPQSD
ncbi:MAG: ABC transporter ATP-binding protein [Desulfovermiculus sp.]